MKAIQCEMCGSSNIIKQDGVYVCQYCGTKYSVEEARKLLADGPVEVFGTVKVDTSGELDRLLQAARNAREISDDESAIRHYERVSALQPDNWEAMFYLVLLRINRITNAEIASAAVNLMLCLPKVFALIKETQSAVPLQEIAVTEVTAQCAQAAQWLTEASHRFYGSVTKGNGMIALTGVTGAVSSLNATGSALAEDKARCATIAQMMRVCGDKITKTFDMNSPGFGSAAAIAWKTYIRLCDEFLAVHSVYNTALFPKEETDAVLNRLAEFDGAYVHQRRTQEAQQIEKQKVSDAKGKRTFRILSIVILVLGMISVFAFMLSGADTEQMVISGVFIFAMGLIMFGVSFIIGNNKK